MLIWIFCFWAYVLFIVNNILNYLTSPFIYFIIYRKHKTPNNTISKLIRTQAQNRFFRESIFTGSRDGSRLRFVDQHNDTLHFYA